MSGQHRSFYGSHERDVRRQVVTGVFVRRGFRAAGFEDQHVRQQQGANGCLIACGKGIAKAGKETGPFTKDQIASMTESGMVSLSDSVWHEGMGDWTPVHQFLGVRPPVPVKVAWMIAEDEGMSRVVARGQANAVPEWAHSVHVEVSGLKPDRWYWYQFKAGSEVSPKARTRTLPAAGVMAPRLRFAFASCQHYETGLYTAFEHMLKEDLDLVFHLGDYIYEYRGIDKRVRKHLGDEITSLDDYRTRHAQYKTDPALQAMHAAVPWVVTWDDHEFDNNCAGDISEQPGVASADFLKRRAVAYQAYYEHMPLRRSALPKGPDMLLYRSLSFGALAQFFVLGG